MPFVHYSLIPRTVLGTIYNGTQASIDTIQREVNGKGYGCSINTPEQAGEDLIADFGDDIGVTRISVGDYITVENGEVMIYDGKEFEGTFRPLNQ